MYGIRLYCSAQRKMYLKNAALIDKTDKGEIYVCIRSSARDGLNILIS